MTEESTGTFSRPVYSGELFQEKKPSPLEEIIPKIKPHAKKIVMAVAAIIVIYIVYWFFIGSYHQVQLRVSGVDGIPTEGIIGSVMQNGKEIQKISRSSTQLSLKEGTYDLELSADDCKPYSDSFTVDSKTTNISAQLEKDIDVKIEKIELKFNNSDGKVFAGTDNEAIIYLTNSSSVDVPVEIVKDTPDDKTLTVDFPPEIIVGKSSQNVGTPFKISVSSNLKVSDRTLGDEKTLKLRIKGLKRGSAEKTIRVVPELNIALSPNPLKFGSVKANYIAVTKEFTLQNKEQFKVEGLIAFSVDITEAGDNAPSEVKKWFEFYPELTELEKSSSTKESVIVKIPLTSVNFPTGSTKLPVKGTITATSNAWSKTIRFEMDVVKAGVQIRPPSLTPSTFTLSASKFETKNATLIVENNSEMPLTGVEVKLNSACLNVFVFPLDPLIIGDLPNTTPQNKKTLNFRVKAPLSATIDEQVICDVIIQYDDPFAPGGDPIEIKSASPFKITRKE